MLQTTTIRGASVAFLFASAFLVLGAFTVQSQRRPNRPVWPKKGGVYIATSSEAIPLFPRTLSEYRSTSNKDYWDKPVTTKGSIRIGEGNGWEPIIGIEQIATTHLDQFFDSPGQQPRA